MSTNPNNPWVVVNSQSIFDGRPWVQVEQEAVRLPSGRIIPDFYRVVLPQFVVVVARTTDGQFILVEGYKHAVGQATLSPAAGQIDESEEPLTAAKREFLEETGYEAEDWKLLGQYIVDGNRHCGTMFLYSARNARQTAQPIVDEAEALEVRLLSAAELLEALTSNRIHTLPGASSIALALLLDGQEDELIKSGNLKTRVP